MFFEKRLRPLLVKRCSSCRSAEAEKVKGGLLLDSRDGVMSGGDTGASNVEGEPGRSLLLSAVASGAPALQTCTRPSFTSSAWTT